MQTSSKPIYKYIELKDGEPGGVYTADQLPARLAEINKPEPAPIVVEPAKPVDTNPPVVDAQTGKTGADFRLTLPDFGTRIDISDLPRGLSWNSDTRTISGKPEKADTRTITINSAKGKLGSFLLTIEKGANEPTPPPIVKPAPPAPVVVIPPDAPNNTRPADVVIDGADQAGEKDSEFLIDGRVA